MPYYDEFIEAMRYPTCTTILIYESVYKKYYSNSAFQTFLHNINASANYTFFNVREKRHVKFCENDITKFSDIFCDLIKSTMRTLFFNRDSKEMSFLRKYFDYFFRKDLTIWLYLTIKNRIKIEISVCTFSHFLLKKSFSTDQ